MNWGTKLMIGMGMFMAMIIVYVVLMMRSDSDALVDKDYYEKGINYNADYRKKQHVRQDKAEPVITLQNDSLVIVFSRESSGKLLMIRTADSKLDQNYEIDTDTGKTFRIPVSKLAKGLWKIQLDWTSMGRPYLYEKELMLP
jgi:hypothetical protein